MNNYEIKITGSGTQEEIAEALRSVANNILSAGAGNPNLATNELDDAEWEDSTLATKISLDEEPLTGIMSDPEDAIYKLNEDGIHIVGSHGVVLNEKIKDEELHEYSIVEREDLIDNLIQWISEAKSSDKFLMRQDMEMLLTWKDDYILSSNSTNSYLRQGDSEFDKACQELLEINEKL